MFPKLATMHHIWCIRLTQINTNLKNTRMTDQILLLDSSETVLQQLKAEHYNVNAGSLGMTNGIRRLPFPIYEATTIIYNPITICEKTHHYQASIGPGKELIKSQDIRNETPVNSLHPLKEHIQNGATLLTFVKHLTSRLVDTRRLYYWIPCFPELAATQDSKLEITRKEADPESAVFQPILGELEIKLPVRYKISFQGRTRPDNVLTLIRNSHRELLSIVMSLGKGKIIILPDYQNNDEVVSDFMNRVAPRLQQSAHGAHCMKITYALMKGFLKTTSRIFEARKQRLKKRLIWKAQKNVKRIV